MIIECPACHARFRLDEAKIRGRGARVRCRRCGEGIVVLRPKETQAASDAGEGFLDLGSVVRDSMGEPIGGPPPSLFPKGEPEAPTPPSPPFAAADEELREPMPPSGPADRIEEEALPSGAYPVRGGTEESPPDLAVDFRPEEKFDLGAPAGPPGETPSDFLISGSESLEYLKEEYREGKDEERFDISASLRSEPQAVPDLMEFQAQPPAAPPVPPEEPPPAAAPPESAPESPPALELKVDGEAPRPKAPRPRKAASRPLQPSLIALVLLFVALAGGGAYLGFTKSGQDLLQGLVPGMESLWVRRDHKAGPQFDVRNLIAYHEPKTRAGNLFVIRGQVVNTGRTRKSGVRIHAALLDGKDQPLAEKISYAGTVLPGETLRSANRAKIEEAFANRFGDKLVNMDIAPGKSVPFMVVFFDAPEGISSYRLEAKEGD